MKFVGKAGDITFLTDLAYVRRAITLEVTRKSA